MASKTVYYDCGCELSIDPFVKQKWSKLCRQHNKPVVKVVTVEKYG